jgi:hypothetical protein
MVGSLSVSSDFQAVSKSFLQLAMTPNLAADSDQLSRTNTVHFPKVVAPHTQVDAETVTC